MSTATKKVLLKVIILGESGVGKTALLNQYVNNAFVESHKATIGADFMTKEIEIDDKLITLQMWDTAGQERFKSLGNSFYRGADAAILVYDITNQDTFSKIDEWRSQFLDLSGEKGGEFPMLLLGNKDDLNNQRAVQQNAGSDLAQRNNMVFFETSAMNGHNIKDAVRAIASRACERNTAPVFSADVIKQIEESDANNQQPDSAGCACQLL